jgi:mRNA interferase RelE/StbE
MYEILFSKKAEDFLNKLDENIKQRIVKKIELLKDTPELGKPLTVNLAGLWSLRIGDYRVLYEIRNNELLILVLKIGHRKNIYI